VVEDDLDTRSVLDALLSNGVVSVVIAGDADTAVAILAARIIDCVVTDHYLEGDHTGLVVAQAAAARRIPVVVLSGFLTPLVRLEYDSAGVVAQFAKPVDLSALRDAVRRAVGLSP